MVKGRKNKKHSGKTNSVEITFEKTIAFSTKCRHAIVSFKLKIHGGLIRNANNSCVEQQPHEIAPKKAGVEQQSILIHLFHMRTISAVGLATPQL